MSVFDSLNNTTEKVTDIGERYIKTSHRYLKLKIFQQLTLTLSLAAKVLLIGGLLFVGLIFCSIAAAIELGEAFNSLALGCLTVSGFYIALAIIIYTLRGHLNKIIIKNIGQTFFT